MKNATRHLSLLVLSGLAGCTHYPVVLRGAFAPAPKKIAVVAFHADQVRGGLFPVRMPEVFSYYQALSQALDSSRLFVVTDPARIAANPAYHSLPNRSRDAYSDSGPLRPVVVDGAAAGALAAALGVDVIVGIHFRAEANEDAPAAVDFPSAQPLPIFIHLSNEAKARSGYVTVWTEVQAWDARGAPIWADQFATDSSPYTIMPGLADLCSIQRAAEGTLTRAVQVAVTRLADELTRS